MCQARRTSKARSTFYWWPFIAVVVTSGVELVFRACAPGDDIVVPVADRLATIHSVLICYSEGRPLDQATEEKIIRLGMVGNLDLAARFGAVGLFVPVQGTDGRCCGAGWKACGYYDSADRAQF